MNANAYLRISYKVFVKQTLSIVDKRMVLETTIKFDITSK